MLTYLSSGVATGEEKGQLIFSSLKFWRQEKLLLKVIIGKFSFENAKLKARIPRFREIYGHNY